MPDANVEAVREMLRQRSEAGLLKYGTTTERTDLSAIQWLQHLQEELLDAAVYVERLKGELLMLSDAVSFFRLAAVLGIVYAGHALPKSPRFLDTKAWNAILKNVELFIDDAGIRVVRTTVMQELDGTVDVSHEPVTRDVLDRLICEWNSY